MPLSICEMRAMLQPTFDDAEEFCRQFRHRVAKLDESSAFGAELLLREALINAIEHGPANDHHKRVFCAVRVGPRRAIIAVRDEGPGFDWRAVSALPPDSLDTHGRGLLLFQNYASLVRFNTQGNLVILVKRFPKN